MADQQATVSVVRQITAHGRLLLKPAKVVAMLVLEGRYVRIVPEGHANLVETIEKPVHVERVDLETVDFSIRAGHRLRFQIEGNLGARRIMQLQPERIAIGL